jgi:hypothetical protein
MLLAFFLLSNFVAVAEEPFHKPRHHTGPFCRFLIFFRLSVWI